MAFTVTNVLQSVARMPSPAGDLSVGVFDVTALAADVYPGAGGEPVDFSAFFREVHHVAFGIFGALPNGNPWPVQIFVPQYDISTANTGVIRFFVEGDAGAGTPLVTLPNANYPFDFRIRCAVFGRPITDAS